MLHLANGIWGKTTKIDSISDFNGFDDTGLLDCFDKEYRASSTETTSFTFSDLELDEIVLRCRLLRSIPLQTARRMLLAMEQAITITLDRVMPSAILSLTVDTFFLDLLARIANKRGVRFIGLVPSFVKEHFRITERGEHVDSRSVTPADIDTALTTLIVKDYRPDFLVQSDRELRQQMWSLWFRNLPKPLWFALRRMIPGEALNIHYWASQIVSKQYWSFWPRQLDSISDRALDILVDDGGLPLVYMPLQMSPEATIDYWSSDTRWIDYERFILDLVRRYRGKWRFVVKEHPNLMGYRSRGFYKRLDAEPNCVMVAPKVPSNKLISMCQSVLVCTGTAGFEAALRGKPVLSDSEPYYAPPGILLPVDTLEGELPSPIEDSARQRALMEHVLRGTLPGRFLNNGKWDVDNPEHRVWSETMAASIEGYLSRENGLEAATKKS